MKFGVSFLFKGLTKNDGGYDVVSGKISHPPKGQGKSPKVKAKTKVTKEKK